MKIQSDKNLGKIQSEKISWKYKATKISGKYKATKITGKYEKSPKMDFEDSQESHEIISENDNSEDSEEIYLSLYHGEGKLGGAFYNVSEGILYLLNDMVDPSPQHKIVVTVLSQLNPNHLLLCSKHNDSFSKAVKDLDLTNSTLATEDSTLQTTTESLDSIRDLQILPGKNFSLDYCRQRIMNQKLPGETEKGLFINHVVTYGV